MCHSRRRNCQLRVALLAAVLLGTVVAPPIPALGQEAPPLHLPVQSLPANGVLRLASPCELTERGALNVELFPQFPASYYETETAFGPIAAGETVLLYPGVFGPGEYLVRARCTVGSTDVLQTGEARLRLDPPADPPPSVGSPPALRRRLDGPVAASTSDVQGTPDFPALGSQIGRPLGAELTAIATAELSSSPEAPGGYWLVGADGGVYSHGTARFAGSAAPFRLDAPIVDAAATVAPLAEGCGVRTGCTAPFRPTNGGYWLVAADGGVFAFGDAPFLGSGAELQLQAPLVGITPTFTGRGYWLVAADGGVFAFGDARFAGSLAGRRLAAPAVGITSVSGTGYTVATADGGLHNFGGDPFSGSATGLFRLDDPVVSVAADFGQSFAGACLYSASGTSVCFADNDADRGKASVGSFRGGRARVVDIARPFGSGAPWSLVRR